MRSAPKKILWAAIPAALVFLVTLTAGAEVKRIPPPKTMAEVEKMMRYTWNREILPAGASADTLQRLSERGQVVLMEDNPYPGIPWSVAAGILIDATPATVFRIITDFDHYPGVIPMTSKAHATPAGMPNLFEVSYTLELLFSWMTMDYSVYHFHRPPYRTDWALASGEFDICSGFYQLIPADGGKRTMFFYSVYSLPRQAALQKMYKAEPALELMTNVATATVVTRAVKGEAEKQEGKKLAPLREKSTVEEILQQDQGTIAKLAGRGKIMVLEAGPTVYVTSATIANASPEVCYQVLTDYASYPKYLPGTQVARVTGKGKSGGPMVHLETSIKIWELNLEEKVDREYVQTPDRISWTITRSTGTPAPGFWHLYPLDGGKRCLLVHGTTIDFRGMGMVPRAALRVEPSLEYGLLGSMETADLNAFRKRMESQPPK